MTLKYKKNSGLEHLFEKRCASIECALIKRPSLDFYKLIVMQDASSHSGSLWAEAKLLSCWMLLQHDLPRGTLLVIWSLNTGHCRTREQIEREREDELACMYLKHLWEWLQPFGCDLFEFYTILKATNPVRPVVQHLLSLKLLKFS